MGLPQNDEMRWNTAVTRFAGFCSELPLSPSEDDISEYHDIIKLFENASEHDLLLFRIAPDRISETRSETVASLRGRWQTRQPVPVDYRYFRGQVRGLVGYVLTVITSHAVLTVLGLQQILYSKPTLLRLVSPAIPISPTPSANRVPGRQVDLACLPFLPLLSAHPHK